MLEALSAEFLKFRRHRATWSLVWIFPIGIVVIYAIGIAVQLARGSPPEEDPNSAALWVQNAASFWNAPTNGLVRYLVAAFTAVVFAGEYGWNTWKLIVPHRPRASLIGAKYVAVIVLLYAAFVAAALLMTGMRWLEDVATGDPIPDGIGFAALAWAHWQGLVATLPAVLLTVAYASVAAILAGSTTAAIVIGIVVTTLEELFRSFGSALAYTVPGAEALYQVVPGYHVANLATWIQHGQARLLQLPFPSGNAMGWGWEASLAVVAAWVVGLVALTFYRFGRQDLN